MSGLKAVTEVEEIDRFRASDLEDLCDATDAAIKDGGGFGWVDPPDRAAMERYWKGVLAVPERTLFVGRLDGIICGSAQLVRPTRNNEAQRFAATLTTSFVAPWARGHGLARKLTLAVEERARTEKYKVLNLDVRDSQKAAITLYEQLGYQRWGTHPYYAEAHGQVFAGFFYYKDLTAKAKPTTDITGVPLSS
ncbi:GNAT family N-acetyltransferase [Indioceanicola profundi]|uniref:GNAT family N-acetyltransferase n=1 Tax=Indioceanicola profundi TaxID=2220096 RepID=UPI000E6AD393|nr:GNAT family N-acetyltransferase [Indioceanicola profundi]